MTRTPFAGFVAGLAVVIGVAGSSSAAPITWEFEGIVRYANLGDASALAGSLGVSVGASAFGRVVYESTTPDSLPGSGTYSGALIEFEVAIGSYATPSIDLAAFRGFYVRMDSVGPYSPYGLEFAMATPPGDELFPLGPILTLSLIPNAAGVIVDSTLPTAPPSLSMLRPFSIEDWFTLGFGTGLQLYKAEPDEQVLVEFTRLEVVPEPAILAVVAPLVLALSWIRRRSGLQR